MMATNGSLPGQEERADMLTLLDRIKSSVPGDALALVDRLEELILDVTAPDPAEDLYHLRMAQFYFNEAEKNPGKPNLGTVRAVANAFFRDHPCENGYTVQAGNEHLLRDAEAFRFKGSRLKAMAQREVRPGVKMFTPHFIAYLKNLDHLDLTIDLVCEGGIVFPHIPLARVEGPIIHVLIFEDNVINALGESTVATTASQFTQLVPNIPIAAFGTRRAPGKDRAYWGDRAAIIGGCASTSNVSVGLDFDLPLSGTQAHFLITSAIGFYTGSKLTAEQAAMVNLEPGTVITPTIAERLIFAKWAEESPHDLVLLTDTLSSLKSGIPNAIQAFRQNQARGGVNKAVRLDSGRMVHLTQSARSMLNAAGLDRVGVMCSDSMTLKKTMEFAQKGLPITGYGIGTAISNAGNHPNKVVYKLQAIQNQNGEWVPTGKRSDDEGKSSIFGDTTVERVYEDGMAAYDIIMLYGRTLPRSGKVLEIVNPEDPRKRDTVHNFTTSPMLERFMEHGVRTQVETPVAVIAAYHKRQLATIWDSYKALETTEEDGQDAYRVNLSPELYELQVKMLRAIDDDLERVSS